MKGQSSSLTGHVHNLRKLHIMLCHGWEVDMGFKVYHAETWDRGLDKFPIHRPNLYFMSQSIVIDMDLTIAMQVLIESNSEFNCIESELGHDTSWFEILKIQNQNWQKNSQQLQQKWVTASSYSGMQFTPFTTQNGTGRLAVWPQAQTHRNTSKLATD